MTPTTRQPGKTRLIWHTPSIVIITVITVAIFDLMQLVRQTVYNGQPIAVNTYPTCPVNMLQYLEERVCRQSVCL